MGRLRWQDWMTLDYAHRVGAVLAAMGAVQADSWQGAVCGIESEEPVVCHVQDGIYALELWHSRTLGERPIAWSYAEAYRAQTGQEVAAPLLYMADIVSAYCDMVADGVVPQGAPVNLCVSVEHPAFVGAVLAHAEGLPLYTVVGADRDGYLGAVLGGAPLPAAWSLLAPYVPHGMSRDLPDVLAAECASEDAADTLIRVSDDNGYLLDTTSARAYYLAEVYREEAESRNPMLVAAPYHPYTDALCLCPYLLERRIPDLMRALAALEAESGWEIPDALREEGEAQRLITRIQRQRETIR